LSEAVGVIDGRSSLFAGGREVRLAAPQTLLPVPREVAASLAARRAKTLIPHAVDLRVLGANPDCYGRLVAYAFARMPSGEDLVQRELLPAGQALVLPAPLAARCRTYLPHAERDAGTGRLGLRGSPYYEATQAVNPLDVLAEQGRFAVMEG